MKYFIAALLLLFVCTTIFAQKDSLKIGDRYADDQIYAAISFAQFYNQPSMITKSSFSYGLSAGFLKDIILNKQGNFSVAAGVGYGFQLFNHQLKVEEINGKTFFGNANLTDSNILKAHNLEFPLEIRWRTSTANKYKFWRIYTGFKMLYNLSNSIQFQEPLASTVRYSNISAYNKLQYGLTFSAGYDEFNMQVFYGLSPVFKDGIINSEPIDSKIIKFGLMFYIL